jgi:hypothetical protein
VILKILLGVGVLGLDEFYHLLLGPALTLFSEGVIVSVSEETFFFNDAFLSSLEIILRVRVC